MLGKNPKFWHVVFLAVAFGSMVAINKQRISIASAGLVTAYVILRQLPRIWRTLTLSLGLLLAGGGLLAILSHFDRIVMMLGKSLTIRQNSLDLAFQYVTAEPLRWLFGVGGTSRFGSVNMYQIFHRWDFYLADLGWPGVVFEYGLVGMILLLALYVAVLRGGSRPAATDADPQEEALIVALWAYVLYLLLTTAIYSAVFMPGELATVTALLVYLRGRWRRLDILINLPNR